MFLKSILLGISIVLIAGCGHRKPVVPAPPMIGGVAGGVPGGVPGGVVGSVFGGVTSRTSPPPSSSKVGRTQTQGQGPSAPSDCPILIFECPGTLAFDHTAVISVLIAPKYSEALGEKLKSDSVCNDQAACKRLIESVCQTGYQELPTAKLWKTSIAPRMTVSLNAPGFQIEHQPTYAEQDPLSDFGDWEWQVRPVDEDEDSRRISFEVYSRTKPSDAPRLVHLSHEMARNVTVTGRESAQVAKAATKALISGFTLTLGKLIQLIIGTFGTAALGAYLKKKWPQLAARFEGSEKSTQA